MTQSPTNQLRIALIGPGRIAVAHLEAIRAASDVATLVAVAGLQEDRDRTEDLAQRFHAERAVHVVEAVIDADDIDAVVLTVPNHVHAPLAIRLLDAGKHVLVEKPLAGSVADTDRMLAAAERNERTLMAGQCRRFFDGARIAKERIRELGRPLSFAHFLGVYVEHAMTDWWRTSSTPGGLALELNGPHVIDTMLWLVGSAPARVFSRSLRLRDTWQGEDETVLVVDFEDGSLATGYLSLNTRPPVNDRWIAGPSGSMKLTDDRNLWIDGEQVVDEPVTPYLGGDISFERQLREFVAAVTESRTPEASATEVRPVAVVMEAAHQSQLSGQPVELDTVRAAGTAAAAG